jgi:hypothetical protein
VQRGRREEKRENGQKEELTSPQRRELAHLCETYERLSRQKQDLEAEAKVCVLNGSKVIGMTTTGVAKYQKIIHSVQPGIIIGMIFMNLDKMIF